ncbi:MAG: GMC family oxidoreductase N-terminal domain-containing protein, partial [Dehalococcoidia bacterium]|nr:GMC family oxidoreductase N-terminal domain-containing protein [Dehalococcoidia bacterium]
MIPNSSDALTRKYDATIVGAGAAGGVMAKELSEKGMKVALIEAGPYLEPKDFMPFEQIYQNERFWSGGLEPNTEMSIIFVRGRGVGGTTLVNQCLMDRAKPWVFEWWSDISGKKEFNAENMNQWYSKIEDQMHLEVMNYPQDFNGNNLRMVEGFEKQGLSWRCLRRGQTNCEDCIHCLGGCPLGSKQGTNITFIPKAMQLGAEVISGYEID